MDKKRPSLFGFLNIYKPAGMTSHDVVARIRKVTGIKQIGHTGTLDPFATGVLPVCIGKATRLIEYLEDDKEYLATIQFGKNTDTYDLEGKVIEVFERKITKSELESALKPFKGEISQFPPIYSAIKVHGKKLYDYARAGQKVEVKPRTVYVSKIELISFDEYAQRAVILIACSKGTYIRSIAYDLGKSMQCGAFLTALERTKAGCFSVEKSVKLDILEDLSTVNRFLINPLDVMKLPVIDLSQQDVIRVSHGMAIECKNINHMLDIVFLVYGGRIYAIGKIEQNKILVKKLLEVL